MRMAIVALVFGLVTITASAENWPEFRGPRGDGTSKSTKLPVKWSEKQNVVWKTPIHDKGWSSPVVWGDQVWVTTAKEDGTELFAIGVDRKTGKVLHDLKLFTPQNPPSIKQFNSHASPTPAIEDGRLYAHFGSYGTSCIDTKTGETLWKQNELKCDHWRGPASSPIIHNDTLFLLFDGHDKQYVVALNKKTGEPIWKQDRKLPYPADGDLKKAYATPSVFKIGDQEQLVAPAAVGTIAYDVKTGAEIWRVIHGGMNESARPILANNHIYLTTGHLQGLWAVKAGYTGDLTSEGVAWKFIKEAPTKSSVLLQGDLLFMVNDRGMASCLNAKTGKVMKQERFQATFAASPLLANGKIYCVSDGGKSYVISADQNFELLETNTLDAGCYGSPAAAHDQLFLRTKTHLYCIGQ
ncbi:MAG: PQQ-binding-like beta-propeller repeat protein [Fimbriiglobus sp.]